MQRMGLDVGTKNIVLAHEKDGAIKYIREVNGFLSIEKGDGFTKQMLATTGVPHIVREKDIVALGEKAEELAYSFGKELQRPMEDGVLSIKEKEAMQIMAVIIRSIIGKINDNILLYYCVPAAPLNASRNVDFHEKIIATIFNSFEPKNMIKAFPMNEARALVISCVPDKTAIGISFGAGMVNVSYCLFGLPIYQFSLIGAGDWIDKKAAEATGENPTAITKYKEKMPLGKVCPTSNIERAIWIHYQLLIEKVAKGIIQGFEQNQQKAKAPKPMPIVISGGTSAPEGFVELFQDVFNKAAMPFKVGDIIKAESPLYSVAKGCLIAAQLHEI